MRDVVSSAIKRYHVLDSQFEFDWVAKPSQGTNMDRFRKILVSVDASQPDESPQSLVRAIRLAKDTGAELRVVDVLSIPSFVKQLFQRQDDADEIIASELQHNLKSMCSGKDAEGVKITTAVLRGRPFVELIREVESHGCDLLLRDVSGDQEPGNLFFGSLDMRLMRNCKCPVWLVKPRPVVFFERILAAIDPMPEGEAEERLNTRIIDLSASLADWEKGKLYVVSAWEVRGEPLLVSKMKPDAFRAHKDDIAAAGRAKLKSALEKLPKPLGEKYLRFRNGNPAEVIKDYAKEVDADLIVMGTLARVGIPGMLIGNTAESVLRTVRSSVLTLKPRAFVSPVVNDDGDS